MGGRDHRRPYSPSEPQAYQRLSVRQAASLERIPPQLEPPSESSEPPESPTTATEQPGRESRSDRSRARKRAQSVRGGGGCSVDREQRQRIADAICEEWDNSHGMLESDTLYERLIKDWDHELHRDALLAFLDELEEHNLISQIRYLGNRRIHAVDPGLCEEPLNY